MISGFLQLPEEDLHMIKNSQYSIREWEYCHKTPTITECYRQLMSSEEG